MKIDGLDLSQYIALVLFVDSFSDIVESEHPEIADQIFKPGKDLMDSVLDFLKSKDIDPMIFVDERPGNEIVRNVNRLWGGKLTVDDLARFDKNSISTLALQSRGHGVSIDDEPRVDKFLKTNGVAVPTTDDLGVELDQRASVGAYKALEHALSEG